jgi:gliding motility-associated-like protein
MITTTYSVIASDSAGCVGNGNTLITVNLICNELYVPNVFSPNGDLHNDKLVISGLTNCIDTFSLSIYDRWGERVFETDVPTDYWDGTYKGKAMSTGVFVYKLIILLIDGTTVEQSGNTTLTR